MKNTNHNLNQLSKRRSTVVPPKSTSTLQLIETHKTGRGVFPCRFFVAFN